MSYIFSTLGLITLAMGILWSAIVLSQPGPATMAKVLAAAPGFSTVFGGLMLLAIGTALYRLGQIAKNTADTADAVEALLPKKQG
ncbi:hypothetical protein [Devosia sp. Naph2]|uniref:hypothetical protein n=1 Tax=Devosia polycyclovorans TaxID=3345148 RepID=UPI0035D0F1B1